VGVRGPHLLLTAALTTSLLCLGQTSLADARPERAAPLASTGYILGGSPDRLVMRDAHGLATLAVAGVAISSNGRSVGSPDAATTHLVTTAHENGLRAELLVSNFSDKLGDFDPRAAARLLGHPDRVRAVATTLAGFVADQSWDGVQIDLESLSKADADGLLLLVQELQARMAPEKSVSIAVMASTAAREYVRRGYQLAELGQAVDTLALMTYDQHGPGWSGPGPIGARSWQKEALATVVEKVPASKVDLGVAGYGYSWQRNGSGHTVTVKQARHLVSADGAKARWRSGPGEWTARLSNGTVLWWSDGRSYEKRLQIAADAGVHGLALWRLGSADPLP
jgi:spore germination protein YaaH